MSITLILSACYRSLKHHIADASSETDEVRQYINANRAIENGTYVVELGEPEVVFLSSLHLSPRIMVPVDGPAGVGDLVFDLPESYDDMFYVFCEAIDADPLSLAGIDGTEVPVRFSGGNAIVMWDSIEEVGEVRSV